MICDCDFAVMSADQQIGQVHGGIGVPAERRRKLVKVESKSLGQPIQFIKTNKHSSILCVVQPE